MKRRTGPLILRSALPALLLSLPLGAQAPDLDLLRERVEGLWKLLSQGQRYAATAYVEEASRERFMNAFRMPVRRYSIEGFSLDRDDPARVEVRLKVETVHPAMKKPLELDLEQRFVWREDNWFLEMGEMRPDVWILGGPREDAPAPGPARIDEQLEHFSLRDTLYDLGRVLQGQVIESSIRYRNDSELLLLLEFAPLPAGFSPERTRYKIEPGGEGEIPFRIDTRLLEGPIEQEVLLRVRRGRAGREIPFRISGTVLAALEAPSDLLLGESGPARLDLRNNSPHPLRVTAPHVSHAFLRVEPAAGLLLEPGATGRLEIRWDALPPRWEAGYLWLEMDPPLVGEKTRKIRLLRRAEPP